MAKYNTTEIKYRAWIHVVDKAVQTSRPPAILMGLETGPIIRSAKRATSVSYFGSSSNFIFVTDSRNCLNGGGQNLHIISGEVAIFFLKICARQFGYG